MKIYVDYITGDELKKQDWIDSKIELLYDLGILKKRKRASDTREDQVRALLARCVSRYEMDILLHDVVRGDMTLNELLKGGKV